MNHILLVLLVSCSVLACSKGDYAEHHASVEEMPGPSLEGNWERTSYREEASLPQTMEPEATPSVSRKLIRSGSMHCQVGSLDSARTQLLALLEGYQGYVSSENASSNYSRELTYTMRVPEDKFDNFILAVEAISSEVLSRNVNVRDVTDQYVDIAARLSTKRALHQRYTELLSRAKNVEEVINVERELSKVLADIESAEARLKSLGDQASYATLSLSLTTAYEPEAQAGFFSQLGESFAAGWSGVKMAVIVGAALWPLHLGAVLLFFGIRWVINRRKKRIVVA